MSPLSICAFGKLRIPTQVKMQNALKPLKSPLINTAMCEPSQATTNLQPRQFLGNNSTGSAVDILSSDLPASAPPAPTNLPRFSADALSHQPYWQELVSRGTLFTTLMFLAYRSFALLSSLLVLALYLAPPSLATKPKTFLVRDS